MIQITEKDDRLLLQFWGDEPGKVGPDGMISISVAQVLVKEIDITGHIERAVESVMEKRAPLLGLLKQTRNYVDRDHIGMLAEIDAALLPI